MNVTINYCTNYRNESVISSYLIYFNDKKINIVVFYRRSNFLWTCNDSAATYIHLKNYRKFFGDVARALNS